MNPGLTTRIESFDKIITEHNFITNTAMDTSFMHLGAVLEQTRRYTSDEWETIKPRVEQVYVKESHTLRQLMAILKEKYGFVAS